MTTTCRFGNAKEIITPLAPMRLSCTGTFADDYIDVHSDLYVRVLVVEAPSGRTMVWVSYDLLFHDRSLNDALAAHAGAYGVNPVDVIVGYVHNHNSPASAGYNPGKGNQDYEELLLDSGRRAIDRAMGNRRSGTIEHARADIDLNVHRRRIVEGKVQALPNPEGPRDTEMVTLQCRDTAGELRAVVVVWACHAVFYPERLTITAEFPGRVCQLLEARHDGMFAMFWQGAAGDVRPTATVVDGSFRHELGHGVVDTFAAAVADAADTQLSAGGEVLDLDIAATSFVVDLPLAVRPEEHFRAYAAAWPHFPGHPGATNAALIAEDYASRPHSLQLHCTLARVAEGTYLATMGGEPVSGIKELVREAVPGRLIFVGYTDACMYIVTDQMLAEGGYEAECSTEFGHLGPLASGVDERITAAFRAAAMELPG